MAILLNLVKSCKKNSYYYRQINSMTMTMTMGPFKCYVTQMGVGGVRFSGKKRYEGVMFNVISVYEGVGWVGVQFAEK